MSQKIKQTPSITLDAFDLPRNKIEAIINDYLSGSPNGVDSIKPAARLAIIKAASDFVLYITDAAIGPAPLKKIRGSKVAKDTADDKKLTPQLVEDSLRSSGFTRITEKINH